MLAKWIEYGPHAVDRMQSRGVTQADVRRLLEGNDREPTWTPEGGCPRWLIVGNLSDLRRVNRREIAIVFCEFPGRYLVITVEWWDELQRRL
jgi:hypothetical protein